MWADFIIAGLIVLAAICAGAWIRTRKRLEQIHIERADLANSSLVIEEERQMLELMAKGAPLSEVVDSLTRAIERISPEALASVLLLDEEQRRFLLKCSGPSLPAEYMAAVNGLEIGPDVGACGSAAYRNETVIVTDIADDYRFAPVRDFVLGYGLRSCWSVPIRDSTGKVLGTFAIYHRYPSSPRAEELRMSRAAAQLAGNAIERIRAEQVLREMTQRLHLAERVAQFGIWEADLRQGTLSVSETVWAMIGRKGPPQPIGIEEAFSLVHPEDVPALRAGETPAHGRGETVQQEFRLTMPDAEIRWMRCLWRFDESGGTGAAPARVLGALIDITDEKNMLARLECARTAAEASAAAARSASRLEEDRKTILELIAKDQPLEQILLIMASAVARHLPGSLCSIQLESTAGSRISVSPRLREPLAAALSSLPVTAVRETLLPQGLVNLSNDLIWRDFMADMAGGSRTKYRAVPILRNMRAVGTIVVLYEDACDCPGNHVEKDHVLESWGQFASLAVERRGLYEQLSFRAQYDCLTSLLNRASLYERLDAQVRTALAEGGCLAVVYLDLDNFKEINDRQGHAAGDLFLQNIACRILKSVRRTDIAARIGGDEFVVILPGVGNRSEAARIGDLIVDSIPGSGASYGIGIYPLDGTDTDTLLGKADEDMYRAKLKRRVYQRGFDRAAGLVSAISGG